VVGDGRLGAAILREHAHGLRQCRALLRQLPELPGVARDLGAAEQVGQLGEALLELLQGLPHGYWMNATSARAGLAARSSATTRSSPRTRPSSATATPPTARPGSRQA